MNPSEGAVKAIGRGRGPWRADQSVIELRRPQSSSSPSVSEASHSASSSVIEEAPDALAVAVQSKLSVDAKEFVPKFFSNATAPADRTLSENYAVNEQDETSREEMTSDEWFLHHLTHVIRSITQNPGLFDQLTESLLDELIPLLDCEETMESITMVIVDQAISERNFRYSGARLCSLLNNHQTEDTTFRRILLTRLHEEHAKIESNLEKSPEAAYGLVQFLGELYIQLDLSKGRGHRIAILGDALVQALKLLIQMPTIENVKHTCNVLKLSGRFLDMDKPEVMQDFFSDLKKLQTDERAETRAKDMISHLLKLRSENWGHTASSENPSTPNSVCSESKAPVWPTDGVYYGADHQALTAEEFKFLNDNCEVDKTASADESIVWDPDVNDTENAEIMAAYLEFINQKKQ